MKIFGYILFLFGLLLILTACPPDPDIKTCPPYCDPIDTSDTTKPQLPYDLVWQVPLFKQDSQYSITRIFNTFYKDKIVISKRKGWSYNEILMAYDTTGRLLWEWEDYVISPQYLFYGPIIDNNIIYTHTARETHAIDVNSGQSIIKNRMEALIPSSFISFTSGKLYRVFDNSISNNTVSRLMAFDKENNHWENEYVVKMEEKDTFDVGLFPPSSWINENGDTILVIGERKHKTINDNWPLRVDMLSYNATQDTLYWKKEHIDHSAFALSNVQNPPIIDGDRIYFFMQTIAYCFDRYTGEILWETKYVHADGDGTGSSNYILAEDKLISVTDQGYVFAIDKNTGKLLYRSDYGGFASYITYYDGRIYYTDNHRLFIVNAGNGNLLYKFKTHNYCKRTPGAFTNGVAINPEQGVMYVQDGFFLMCIKLPE